MTDVPVDIEDLDDWDAAALERQVMERKFRTIKAERDSWREEAKALRRRLGLSEPEPNRHRLAAQLRALVKQRKESHADDTT